MKVAFCVYDGMTFLDFVGAYDPITRLDRMDFMDLSWDICARTESVRANELVLDVDRVEPDLSEYNLTLLPGGYATRELQHDEEFIRWIQTAETCDYVVSVCTGSLLLGAAGFLKDRRATTHPNAFEALNQYTTVVENRIVKDKNIITGGGVAAAIDLGLYVVEMLTNEKTRVEIAEQMDYPYGRELF